MECAFVSKLSDGPQWVYEIKLDGYRAIAVNSEGKLTLFSRRAKSFNKQFPHVVEGLSDLPTNTVVDGEVVALDESGRPDFNLLQNFRSGASRIHYFVFDLLIYKNRDLTHLPLIERREIMRSALQFVSTRVHISDYAETSATNMLRAVREQGLEGVVAKRKDSLYEPGKRTGPWIKLRLNRGQELVIGGSTLRSPPGLPVLHMVPIAYMPSPIPRQVGWNLFARTIPSSSAFPRTGAGRLLHCRFRGLLSVHSRYGLHARRVAFSDPLHQRLQQSRCLHCRSDCYRVERTSSRAGIPPLWTSAFHGAPG